MRTIYEENTYRNSEHPSMSTKENFNPNDAALDQHIKNKRGGGKSYKVVKEEPKQYNVSILPSLIF